MTQTAEITPKRPRGRPRTRPEKSKPVPGERKVVIPYRPREHQAALHRDRRRFSVLVCHRRFGKTVWAINDMLRDASLCTRESPRYAYVAPFYKQAKQVAWDYVRRYAGPIPGIKFNEAELRADLPNGARITLLGADNPDSQRGIYLDGVVLDEVAQMPRRLWGEIIRPALVDRPGWATFIGTPQGKNLFYELFHEAKQHQADGHPDWYADTFRASETGIISPEELAAARLAMTPEQYEQEFECSFLAAIIGAYYGRYLADAESEHRVGVFEVEPGRKVHTAWDLGMSDSTAIWFFQVGEYLDDIRVVDYYENNGEGLEHYVSVLRQKNYPYGTHVAPHDINVRELSTGKTRLETARSLGVNFICAPNIPIMDGINAVRRILPRCHFNVKRCTYGLDALREYRVAMNEKLGIPSDRPVHDHTSHAADAFRYLAVGLNMVREKGMSEQRARNLYERYAPPCPV